MTARNPDTLKERDTEATSLFSKIRGCIVGGAVGDAMGIVVEMMHYQDIADQFGRVTTLLPRQRKNRHDRPFYETIKLDWRTRPSPEGFHPYGAWSDEAGTYTDDMRQRLLGYQALINKGGRITARELAEQYWRYGMNALGVTAFGTTYTWTGPQREWAFPWGNHYAGMASLDRLSALMNAGRPFAHWDAPAGVINACDPDLAAQDGSATAVAVAEAIRPGATVDSVIGAVLDRPDCFTGPGAPQFQGRLTALLDIAARVGDVSELYRPYYDRFLVPYGVGTDLEMIPFALAAFKVCKGDPRMTIVGAVNVGRDADTIACTAGEIAGAFAGYDAIPRDWAETVQRVNPNPDMKQVALELTEVVARNLRKRQKVVEDLQGLL